MSADTPRTDATEGSDGTIDACAPLCELARTLERELAEAEARDEFNWNIIKGCMEELEMKDMGPSMIRGEIQEWKCSHERLKAKEVAATDRAVLLALERDTLRAERERLERVLAINKSDTDSIIASIRARVTELEQDKARLDWLEDNHNWILAAEFESPTFSCGSNENFQNWALKVATVRQAIDAARTNKSSG